MLRAMRIAVLDLGSTTFHLQHVEIGDGSYSRSLDAKLTLRLGDHVFSRGHFDAVTRACVADAVGELLARSASQRPNRVAVVATSPFRQADNGAELAAELEQRFGVDVTILTPHQEAMLAYLGNTTLAEVGGRRTAVVDLGGGSAEIAVGEGTRCIHAISLPVGAVRMRRLVAFHRPFGRSEAAMLAEALREALEEPMQEIRGLEPHGLVFASGTARAVRQLFMRSGSCPGKTGPLDLVDLRRGLGTHLGWNAESLQALGVEPARADTVLVAATIMSVLADMAGVERCRVSDRGLRDGVALEVYRRARALRTRLDWA